MSRQYPRPRYREHQQRSIAASQPKGDYTTGDERNETLEEAKYKGHILAYSLTCVHCRCGQEIKLRDGREFDLTKWKRHFKNCPHQTGIVARTGKTYVKVRVTVLCLSTAVLMQGCLER